MRGIRGKVWKRPNKPRDKGKGGEGDISSIL